MGAIGASAFIFRDIIRYILPTVIGLALFVPLFTQPGSISIEGLVLIGILLAYVVHGPLYTLANWTHKLISLSLARSWDAINLVKVSSQRVFWTVNWRYDILWLRLDQDEREYLYMTAAYGVFAQTTGFYFLVYAAINLVRGMMGLSGASTAATLWSHALATRTALLGDWSEPSLVVGIVALLAAFTMLGETVTEHSFLYGDEGYLKGFAETEHRESGDLARAVWGQVVTRQGDELIPVKEVTVKLYLYQDQAVGASEPSDKRGFFQVADAYERCRGYPCRLVVDDQGWWGEKYIVVRERAIPEYQVEVSRQAN